MTSLEQMEISLPVTSYDVLMVAKRLIFKTIISV